jgi:hypothetical protein
MALAVTIFDPNTEITAPIGPNGYLHSRVSQYSCRIEPIRLAGLPAKGRRAVSAYVGSPPRVGAGPRPYARKVWPSSPAPASAPDNSRRRIHLRRRQGLASRLRPQLVEDRSQGPNAIAGRVLGPTDELEPARWPGRPLLRRSGQGTSSRIGSDREPCCEPPTTKRRSVPERIWRSAEEAQHWVEANAYTVSRYLRMAQPLQPRRHTPTHTLPNSLGRV